MEAPSGFAALGLGEPLLSSLVALGYEEPTPIQTAAIPPLLEGRDLLGQAATGTGKTAAFALPMLSRVKRDGATRALVLVPTRELAMQVAEAVARYGKDLAVRVVAIYGGAPMMPQITALKRGATVVVATPGRALDHLRRRTLRLEEIEMLVLDEADEMLDMGFAEDLETILTATPETRQTALFSATLPPRIVAISGRHLRNPIKIAIARERLAAGELPKVRQTAYLVARAWKPAALARVLDVESPTSAMVFCRTRTEVDELTEALKARGHKAEALHGGLSQDQRDRVMKRFRAGATSLLVATDVAARGLDIEHVSHVVNYDVPSAPEAYVHRIGRTGRAGREGVAITLTEPREQRQLRNIEALTRHKIAIAEVPTVADLRARRTEQLRASLRATIAAGGLDAARAAASALAQEFPALDVAAAALKLYGDTRGVEDETEIPAFRAPVRKPPILRAPERGAASATPFKASTAAAPFKKGLARIAPAAPVVKASAAPASAPDARIVVERAHKGAVKRTSRKPEWAVARLYVGAGHEAGVRPADIVGAIANEAGVEAKSIGAIEVGVRYTIVEVPEEIAEQIITALRNTKIKGRKVVVRLDRDRTT